MKHIVVLFFLTLYIDFFAQAVFIFSCLKCSYTQSLLLIVYVHLSFAWT